MRPEIKGPLPGPKAKAIIDRDKAVSSPSYIKEYPLCVERGEGSWIYDVDGNRFLDFMAGIAVAATGHSHPKVVQAIHESSSKFLHICSTDFYYEPFAKLCEKLAGYYPSMGKKRVYLSNSGAEAVEAAIKLARFHTKRSKILAFHGAFHGRTMGAVSLTASKKKYRAHFGPLLPGVFHVPYSNPFHCPYNHEQEWCEKQCECGVKIEENFFKSLTDPSELAAIFVEPVQGEGGYIFPAKKFLQDLRRICDENKILLVFDEVQSGVGRTGEMFAGELYGVAPDIFLSAKGLGSGMPIGAMVAREDKMTWERGTHGSTYAGNPVCCAAAIATLEVVEEMLPQIRKTGEFARAALRKLAEKHPVIADVRGKGLMIGVEFLIPSTKKPAGDYVGQLEQLAFQNGLLLLPCGESTIRIAPPLIITEDEVTVGMEILDECLTKLGNPS